MRRLLFHVGQTKTGSSALQVFLAKNRTALLDLSVDYLPIGGDTGAASGKISSGNGAWLLRNLTLKPGEQTAPEIMGAREELVRAIENSSCDTGIVSSEMFSGLRPALFSPLLDQIRAKDISVEVAYFIREQEQSLCSIYMQQVKRHLLTDSPEQYIASIFRKSDQLIYNSYYEKWLKLFDPAAIHCIIYEEARRMPQGIFGAFMTKASLPTDGLDFAVTDVNNSLSPGEIGIMIALNRYAPRMYLSDLLVENSRDSGRTQSGSQHRLISGHLSQQIREYFSESNTAFARRYFHRANLFDTRSATLPDETPIDVTRTDPTVLLDTLAGILVKYDNRMATLERQIASIGKGASASVSPKYEQRLAALEELITNRITVPPPSPAVQPDSLLVRARSAFGRGRKDGSQ